MRPLERIDEISDLIKEIWNENPDMRYMQLLYTLQSSVSQKNMDVGKVEERVDKTYSRIGFDLFNIEDKEFKIFLENYLFEQRERNA
ncbi:DUF1040 family protein [Undibacterium sp. LX40W]|uniref:DUF1040 family protein n=1 Tax=Undibacterium nitidum TaxID=2762298 RepID=A0A923HT99_9BURK|nr:MULTISPECIES: DUF1040 family protein [Undibacterium]MBC3882157.1 DUF1040 family protein [Undibacterium nitidum]MBC3892438.1 DUF1040 family protein [Undibacterium sp. LX40W]